MRSTVLVVMLLAVFAGGQDLGPNDASSAEYQKALRLLERKKWSAGQKALRKFVKKFPESPYVGDAAVRSDDNCYLGTDVLYRGGPSARRIDIAVMGDGFTHEASSQRKQEQWADECIKVLWHEKGLSQYRTYFNVYFVRLCSLEEGVDPNLTPEQLEKIRKKNRSRSKSRQKRTDFSTALDAKAAGPQGQVMMDRRLVYKWLEIAEKDVPGVGDDRYVIAFAQFGRLGMGGGGIANVGRPDKSVTTHEFGHAFARLLDEYANNPNAPQGMYGRTIRAANAYASGPEPKKDEVPWAHMLKKRVKGVGIFEGGATFKKGVWRPARSCAMNSAGNNQFCPVCREQAIKVIYEHVSPIDEVKPAPTANGIEIVEGEAKFLTVFPMEPYKHSLKATWNVVGHVVTATSEGDVGSGGDDDGFEVIETPDGVDPQRERPRRPRMFRFGGDRGRQDRSKYNNPPSGKLFKQAKWIKGKGKGKKRRPTMSQFPLAKLGIGVWRVTCQISDPTPWVIKDDKSLLKERVTWVVTVKAEVRAAPG